MTEAQITNTPFPRVKKREINWAQYLDVTRFVEEDTENEQLEKFRDDFTI